MDNQQIKEVLESLLKKRKEHKLQNVVSQESIDKLVKTYFENQKEPVKTGVRPRLG